MLHVNKRLVVAVGVLLVIGTILAVAYVYRARFTPQKPGFAGVTPTVLPRLGNAEIASRLLTWISNTRTDNGGYAEGEVCAKEGACDPLVIDNRIGAVGLWARFRSYQKTKGYEAMAIMNQDLKTFTDPNKVPTIQPLFWNCKLIYELWKSTIFNQEQKDQLQVICARSVYNTFDLTFPDTAQVEETAKLQVVQEREGKRLSGELVFLEPVDKEKLFEYAINSSERVAMWEWAGDKEDLRQAHLFFMGAVEAMRISDVQTKNEQFPVVGIAALDLNRVAPSPAFANYAAYLFKQYISTPCGSLQGCVLRAYFYHELYKLNKKEEYKIQRDMVLNALYDGRFDMEGLKGFSLGKQAYYDNEQKNKYWMVPNGVLAGLLLDL